MNFTLYGVIDRSTDRLVSNITNPRHKYWEKRESAENAISQYNHYKYDERQLEIVEIECRIKTTNEINIESKIIKEEKYCKWFKYDYRTIAPKNHGNIWAISEKLYWRYNSKDAHIKFCPYCGKEINIIE